MKKRGGTYAWQCPCQKIPGKFSSLWVTKISHITASDEPHYPILRSLKSKRIWVVAGSSIPAARKRAIGE